MKTSIAPFALITVFALAGGSLAAGEAKTKSPSPVEVTYVASEEFTDFKDSVTGFDRDRENLEHMFREHLEKTATRYLAEGQRLEVRFTDIDLAGDFEPWRGVNFSDIRILKDIYPPRMKLEFRLIGADGKVLAEGKRQLSDLSYLMTLSLRRDDSLRYDKDLLDEWLRSEFKRAS